MKTRPSTVPEDRPLTEAEAHFIEWLLSHGDQQSQMFLPQLSSARVNGRCSCGCASINLSVDGVSHYGATGMQTMCEYQWQSKAGELFGVFAFSCGGLLAGIELWSIDGRATATALPPVSILRPMQ